MWQALRWSTPKSSSSFAPRNIDGKISGRVIGSSDEGPGKPTSAISGQGPASIGQVSIEVRSLLGWAGAVSELLDPLELAGTLVAWPVGVGPVGLDERRGGGGSSADGANCARGASGAEEAATVPLRGRHRSQLALHLDRGSVKTEEESGGNREGPSTWSSGDIGGDSLRPGRNCSNADDPPSPGLSPARLRTSSALRDSLRRSSADVRRCSPPHVAMSSAGELLVPLLRARVDAAGSRCLGELAGEGLVGSEENSGEGVLGRASIASSSIRAAFS